MRHTLAVYNPSEPELRFGIGYHPAFASRLMMLTPLRIMSSVLTSWKAPCA